VVAATDPSGNLRTNAYQVTESGSTTSYTYDLNGNHSGDGTKTLEWDAENRLTAVKQGGATLASFIYDGQGRRFQKLAAGVTTTYVYDGSHVIEERLSTGGTWRHVHGPGIDREWAVRDEASVVTYFLSDHLGSTVQTTNTAGTVTLSREYDPYGNLISGAGQSGYAFTGREWDSETGLHYYRARYYDSKIGRFVSEDPIGLRGGTHLYRYVYNNPANLTDPGGQLVAPVPHPAVVVGALIWGAWQIGEKIADRLYPPPQEKPPTPKPPVPTPPDGGQSAGQTGQKKWIYPWVDPNDKCGPSDPDDDDDDPCEQQRKDDEERCRRQFTSPLQRTQCWQNSTERYADCKAGKPPRPHFPVD